MNNPFEYVPGEACVGGFGELVARIEELRRSHRPEDVRFCREMDAGKMLGVLVAADPEGDRHTLFAFSGQLADGGFHFPGFVEPVFDYLEPEGHFKTKEQEISRQNAEITRFETQELRKVREENARMEAFFSKEVEAFREKCRVSKSERDARRAGADERELAEMVRQSQFEKAELRRMKKRAAERLEPFAAKLQEAEAHLASLKQKRKWDSEELQQWLFENFTVLNARGESRSLSEIFAATALKVPPSGAGECCAPKLLQAAYRRGWQPLELAEYWYGKPKDGEVRRHGEHYPACRGKCLPILTWMLQGLDVQPTLSDGLRHSLTVAEPEILFENQWFCVVNKPSGMLSVPGKGKAVSVQEWLERRYGKEKEVKVAHRLDQDTSGLLVATFGPEAYREMQRLFALRQVKKRYVAELEGDYREKGLPQSGTISLPLSPDWLDRPRQRVDLEHGKEAITDYEFIGVKNGRSHVIFYPHTGRTHQLRVHAASDLGLGMPIVGDRLYGRHGGHDAPRLMLHAEKIEFSWELGMRKLDN